MVELSRQLVQPRDLRSSLVSVSGWLYELGRGAHFLGSMTAYGKLAFSAQGPQAGLWLPLISQRSKASCATLRASSGFIRQGT